jgi:hypothetical protein
LERVIMPISEKKDLDCFERVRRFWSPEGA